MILYTVYKLAGPYGPGEPTILTSVASSYDTDVPCVQFIDRQPPDERFVILPVRFGGGNT